MTNSVGNIKEVTASIPRFTPMPITQTVAAIYREYQRINRCGEASRL